MNLELAVGGKKFVDGTDITDPAEDGEDAAGIITYGLAHVTDAAKNPELLLALRGVNMRLVHTFSLPGNLFTCSLGRLLEFSADVTVKSLILHKKSPKTLTKRSCTARS